MISMKRYKIVYTLKRTKRIATSPHTGKLYKKPRIRRQWIELSEYIMAESLNDALTQADIMANRNKWDLEAIREEESVKLE